MRDVYENFPEYETPSLKLRLVKKEDAPELLKCYSDKKAVARMNDDNCSKGFYLATLEEMEQYINIWLWEYGEKHYVRFTITDKKSGAIAGTIEIFGGEFGVLRTDLAAAYDTTENFDEIIELAALKFIPDFGIEKLYVKSSNVPDRIPALEKWGFTPSEIFRGFSGYHSRVKASNFAAEKGFAYCGLACCVCSENANCPGCRKEGCSNKEWCKSFNCCCEKGINGCWECAEFNTCDNVMLKKPRVHTFAEILGEGCEKRLIEALKSNEENGILYHYPEKLVGDYDNAASADEIKEMLNIK